MLIAAHKFCCALVLSWPVFNLNHRCLMCSSWDSRLLKLNYSIVVWYCSVKVIKFSLSQRRRFVSSGKSHAFDRGGPYVNTSLFQFNRLCLKMQTRWWWVLKISWDGPRLIGHALIKYYQHSIPSIILTPFSLCVSNPKQVESAVEKNIEMVAANTITTNSHEGKVVF